MRTVKEVLKRGIEDPELITCFSCIRCKTEVRKVRQTIMGGPNKGEIQILMNKCYCSHIDKLHESEKRRKIEYFDRYSKKNNDLENASFLNFKPVNNNQSEALRKSILYVNEFNPKECKKLLFQGGVGRGKSHLAVSIYKEIKKRGYTAIYFEITRILQTIKDTWGDTNKKTQSDFMKALQDVDLLVIDDLGREKITDWSQEMIFEILNSRLGKCTIFTTNFVVEDLYEGYTQANADRIFDKMGRSDIILIDTPFSYRQLKLRS